MSFKRFDLEDVVVSADSVTAPIWTGEVVQLSAFYTSSTQQNGVSGDYYLNVFQTASTNDTARTQFGIAYADKLGSGSTAFNSSVPAKSPSSVVYGQYRNIVLGDEDTNFTFGSVVGDYFYAISLDRARYKEKLLPGTLELKINHLGNSLTLTDDSVVDTTVTFSDSGRVYELITGSLGVLSTGKKNVSGHTNSSGSYGKFLPDIGVILLNGNALDTTVSDGGLALGINRVGSSGAFTNLSKGFELINSSSAGTFKLQSEETISSNFVFVRARNSEFNYSTNPSFTTGSGEIRHSVMVDRPQSFVTAVGLYNDNNDLLGVAKLSRPLLKDFTKEALIRIKLDY